MAFSRLFGWKKPDETLRQSCENTPEPQAGPQIKSKEQLKQEENAAYWRLFAKGYANLDDRPWQMYELPTRELTDYHNARQANKAN